MELTIGTKIQRLDSRLRNALRLLTGKQDTIPDLPNIRTGAGLGATAYQKPGGGIPKGDLATQVTNSLNLADSAIQDGTPKVTLGGAELKEGAICIADGKQFSIVIDSTGLRITDSVKGVTTTVNAYGITTK